MVNVFIVLMVAVILKLHDSNSYNSIEQTDLTNNNIILNLTTFNNRNTIEKEKNNHRKENSIKA